MSNIISSIKSGMYIYDTEIKEYYYVNEVIKRDACGISFIATDSNGQPDTYSRYYNDDDIVKVSKDKYDKALNDNANKSRLINQIHSSCTLSESSIGDDFDGIVYLIFRGRGDKNSIPDSIMCTSGWCSTKLIDDNLVVFYQYLDDAKKYINKKSSLSTSYMIGSVRIFNCKFDWTTLKYLTETIKVVDK